MFLALNNNIDNDIQMYLYIIQNVLTNYVSRQYFIYFFFLIKLFLYFTNIKHMLFKHYHQL